jgi:hypothetical protein
MIARASAQQQLLDVPPRYKIGNNANARNAYGAAAQEIACAALGLSPIPINGKCAVCFDAETDKAFFEIKSVKRSGKVVVYDWRMTKESEAAVELARDEGKALFYAIVIHGVKGCRDGADLIRQFALAGVEILVVSAWWVYVLAKHETQQRILSEKTRKSPGAMGYNRKGYCDGYRNIPINKIRSYATRGREISMTLHNVAFDPVVIHEA